MGRRRRRSRRKSGRTRGLLLLSLSIGGAWWLESRGVLEDLEIGPRAEAPLEASASAYDRDDWPHWIDADGDCQDTRQEVLVEESEVPVRYRDARRCAVAEGRWRCPYTGEVITDPRKLDVDHLVPLHEAHRSGADAWDRDRRRRYANALDEPMHLIAVERGSNRAKGDKAPHLWMPESPEHRCDYVHAWIEVKDRWELKQSAPEQVYLDQALAACAGGKVPKLPR